LQLAQKKLLPKPLKKQPQIKTGIAYHTGSTPTGLFGDFFDLGSERYALLIGKPTKDIPEGILYSGMIKSILNMIPRENLTAKGIIETLDKKLKEITNQTIAACCLILDLPQNRLQFISCGYGTLWSFPESVSSPHEIVTYNEPLGSKRKTELIEAGSSWNSRDNLLIFGVPELKLGIRELLESQLLHGLVEYTNLPPQDQVEGLLRKIRLRIPATATNSIIIKIERI
jgi:serine phosphatase RsbU (regulator of sigma subunit)